MAWLDRATAASALRSSLRSGEEIGGGVPPPPLVELGEEDARWWRERVRERRRRAERQEKRREGLRVPRRRNDARRITENGKEFDENEHLKQGCLRWPN